MASSEVLKALAVTAELCGANLSQAAAQIIVADLSEFDEGDVLEALTRMRREHEGRFSLAAIIKFVEAVRQENKIKNRPIHTCAYCPRPATRGGCCDDHHRHYNTNAAITFRSIEQIRAEMTKDRAA